MSHATDEIKMADHVPRSLELYKFVRDKDKELGFAFGDFRRSTARLQIRIIKNLGVITDEELIRYRLRRAAR